VTCRRALLAALFALVAQRGLAQGAPEVQITGRVAQAQSYSMQALASMPAVEVSASREGGAVSRYVGAPLWPLIAAAGPVDGPERGAHLQHVLVARGADGYAVVLAIGEVDPGFEGKQVIVAYKQDDALLPAPRLVVPGDKRAGRNVRDLVAIEVR
jgi:hypothetical protein